MLRPLAASLAVTLAILLPLANPSSSSLMPQQAAQVPSLQASPEHPLWDVLTATDRTPAEWAVLLTSDGDGNLLADFLDVALPLAQATGLAATPVEVLVRASPEARAFLAQRPGSADLPAAGAVFLTVPLGDVRSLLVPGVEQVVWEPRASVAWSTNPAGGSPDTMAQITLHGGDDVWGDGYTGDGIRIAVLDTGADTGHQALDSGKVTAFKDCVNGFTGSYDDHGHGTHVASIAAGHDGTDFKGIAPEADLVVVKVLNAGGSGTLAQFACGTSWILNGTGARRADVASMSAGLTVPPLGITTLNGGPIDYFGWDRYASTLPLGDIPFTVAAGNWIGPPVEVLDVDETTHVGINGVNQVSSPGYAPQVLTVGAVSSLAAAGHFTALGPGSGVSVKPDVAAMGVDTWGALKGTTDRYDAWDGTSMATPLAAGVVALMMDADGSIADNSVYEAALRNGATPACLVSTSSGGCLVPMERDPNFVVGHGIVNADASIALI